MPWTSPGRATDALGWLTWPSVRDRVVLEVRALPWTVYSHHLRLRMVTGISFLVIPNFLKVFSRITDVMFMALFNMHRLMW